MLGFVIANVTIIALAIALSIRLGTVPVEGSPLADPRFFAALVWIGSIGGFICATIIAVKTAWAAYAFGSHRKLLERKVG